MIKPNISRNFTIDYIHKVREYNYEMTKNMTSEERSSYYKHGAAEATKIIEEFGNSPSKAQGTVL